MSRPDESDDAFDQRLSAYAELFRNDFQRRDQARWIGVYLRSLLHQGRRQAPETPAVFLPADITVEDPAQALQHFINQSPWDERKLWRRYRDLFGPGLVDPQGVFVIDSLTFPKQGRHSVGVHRQYSSSCGKKINCQIAVSLQYAAPLGSFPLSACLYLPRSWLRPLPGLTGTSIPPGCRHYRSKAEIALALLDQVRSEGWASQFVVAGEGYGVSPEFRDGLANRGLSYLVEIPRDSNLEGGIQDFGAASPSASRPLPESLFVENLEGLTKYALSNLAAGTQQQETKRLWRCLQASEQTYLEVQRTLGLDRFEGRSWRGFHHHVCLVMLGYGFLLAERLGNRSPLHRVL